MLDLVQKRRQELKDPNIADVGGLMSTLIQMDLFSGNDDMIVDECFTFFFAGSQTLSASISNEVLFLTQNPELKKKALDELSAKIVDPFEKEQGKKFNLVEGFNIENL